MEQVFSEFLGANVLFLLLAVFIIICIMATWLTLSGLIHTSLKS